MRRILPAMLLIMLFAGGCAARGTPIGGLEGGGSPSPDQAQRETDRAAAVYASVIRQLVTKDHTFGRSDPDFEAVYVIDGQVNGAGDPLATLDSLTPETPFPPEVKEALRTALADLPPLTFVQDRDSVVTGQAPGHVVNHGVLLTLGPLVGTGAHVKVANNLWISGLAGQWLTYVVEGAGTEWKIVGTDGPVAIS